ncbi:MAG: IS66 family transposase [Armatimonadaceae bacterium]
MELPNTVESCHVLINNLLSIIEHQQKQIDELQSRFADLEARLDQNSRNSSRPPSSDGFKRKPGIPKEPKGQGGQRDHKGNTLRKIDDVDHRVRLTTPVCTCGLPLDPESGVVVQTCQVFDLPQPKLEVTEYQVMQQICPCGRIHCGKLPPGITATVQYGDGVRALTVLLNNSCQLSFQKISTLFEDVFGYDLNESTAISNNELAYERLETTEDQIKEALIKGEVTHFDESGIKVGVKLKWLHVACSTMFTYLFVSEKRGSKAHHTETSILSRIKNWAIHDCYGTYFKFNNCRHALCNPHILRELQAQVEQGKLWAANLQTFLLELYKKSEKGTQTIPNIASEKKKWLKMCKEAIQIEELLLLKKPPPDPLQKKKRGRKARGKALSLLDRLVDHDNAVMAFAEYEAVPFSNNQAERDIRPVKTKQKVAGCFRTSEGADRYARIQGFISTCRKHQLNVFNELRAVCSTADLYVAPFGC